MTANSIVQAALAYAREIGAWTALDTYCGEGGMSMGLVQAGAVVVGVDNDPARCARYPWPVIQGDAIQAILRFGHLFDMVHASPPCTGYTRGTAAIPDRFDRYDRLIPATRDALQAVGSPYVIENVEDAWPELQLHVMLCGRMFGLSARDDDGSGVVVDRHRLFETSWDMKQPFHDTHDMSLQVAGAYGGARRDKHEARHVRKGGYVPANVNVLRQMLGVPWMSEKGCFLSIPPVYGLYVAESFKKEVPR